MQTNCRHLFRRIHIYRGVMDSMQHQFRLEVLLSALCTLKFRKIGHLWQFVENVESSTFLKVRARFCWLHDKVLEFFQENRTAAMSARFRTHCSPRKIAPSYYPKMKIYKMVPLRRESFNFTTWRWTILFPSSTRWENILTHLRNSVLSRKKNRTIFQSFFISFRYDTKLHQPSPKVSFNSQSEDKKSYF